MVTVQTTSIPVMHFEHRLWLNKLKFYRQEIAILEQILEKVLQGHREMEARARVEQLQNNFIRQREVIDELRHDIKLHEKQLASMLRGERPAAPAASKLRHLGMEEEMNTFERLFEQLRAECRQFYADMLP